MKTAVKMDTLIPASNESSVPCRVKTGDIDNTLPVLSKRDESPKLSTGLDFHEALTSVKKGTKAAI